VDECTAAKHAPTTYSYRLGCRCPETVSYSLHMFRQQSARARARGYVSPGPRRTDVDEVAVLRALHGDRLPLTVAERGLAIAQLTRAGLSAVAIAERVGVSARQVVRYRGGQIQHAVAAMSLARETPRRETEAA
jgi:DNA-binding CsgD family transcriptional regulator